MTTTTVAELTATVDNVAQYRQRVAALVAPHLDSEREDLVAALYEGERSLLSAERALRRALRVAEASI